jgi:predicted permease
MQTFWQDLRYAFRMLGKSPGLALVIVVSLAIGIGANSAIFSVVDALLLRPLPYSHPERLAAIWLHSPGIGIFRDWPSPGQYIDLRTENHSFEDMAIARLTSFTLTGYDQPEQVYGMRTSSSLLWILGAKPLLGRLLLPEDDTPGKQQVAILSHGLWQRRFNTDPHVIGKSITLNNKQFTVAGVLPSDFVVNTEVMPAELPMDRADIFLPLPLGADAATRRGDENYNILVRLKPNVSLRQAQADVGIIAARIREKDKRDRTFGMHVVGLLDQVVGDVRRALLVLLGSVTLVLLSACANVANLLLTRAAGREKEVAIRTALGAGTQRLVRQLLTESILLALLGGLAGLVIAQWSLHLIHAMNPGNIPRLGEIHINFAVLLFTFGVSLLTGILFGLAPIWRAVRLDLNTSLKSGGRSGQTDGGLRVARHRLRGLLVVSQLALSLMLLIGAGLLIRSFVRLQNVAPGFTVDHVLSMQVVAQFKNAKEVGQGYHEIGERIRKLPGVIGEGLVSALPLTGGVGWGQINVQDYHPAPGQELQSDFRTASTDYFRTMQIPLLKGRFFDDHDNADSQPVAIVDEKFAKQFWPHDNPVGKHVWFDDPKKPIIITGVVGVVKHYGLDTDQKIVVYFPFNQNRGNETYLVLRSSSDPAGLAAAVTREIHEVDRNAPVFDVRTMQDRLYDSLARQRFASTMLAAFAAFALLVSAIGVYGVISYLVAQSTHDIGLRMALGARPGSILTLVVRQGMELAAIGIVVGLIGAATLTRVLSSLLFGVSAYDAVTFVTVAAVLATVTLLATAIPAFRATRVDPMEALRIE